MDSGIRIITRDPAGADGWKYWRNPISVHQAYDVHEVIPLLSLIDEATRKGRYAIGFVSYEAGSACDSSFSAKPNAPSQPLAWFALFETNDPLSKDPASTPLPQVRWQAMEKLPAYRSKITAIKYHIAAGNTYQVNYTFPLQSKSEIDSRDLFFTLYKSQPSPYAMLIETPEFQIMSASPELFFKLEGEKIICEPMKGTCPRGLHPSFDLILGKELQTSEKNRAENVMVVDMVRNDLSHIAESGSVKVDELFKVTPWPTLWQMTSTVSAQTKANLPELFTALFPSASITGAPKLKASEIISELEVYPRGVYTGAIGWWFPNRLAQFSVAIRTATHLTDQGITTYGIGSGIVWDSNPDDEYRECLLKARILRNHRSAFRLLETMRWDPSQGYIMLEEHLQRIMESARYFHFQFDPQLVRTKLRVKAKSFKADYQRIRLLVSSTGRISIEHQALTAPGHYTDPAHAPEITAVVDSHRTSVHSPFLFHKTTRRNVYVQAHKRFPDVDEVLLVNNRGELMEFTAGNLVVKSGSDWLTPEVQSGLLPGVFRDQLIANGRIRTARLTCSDISTFKEIYFINSVRGWRRVQLIY